jgi:hypothetical protein
MDVCTLVLITTMTTQMCYSPNVCRPSEDGARQLCSGLQPTACPAPPITYECVRPDGTRYKLTQSEAK